jgi:hypothetical protein
MYNIIRADGDKSVNAIPNANVINEIFEFSTKMIVEVSWNCQQKHNEFGHNPYTTGFVALLVVQFMLGDWGLVYVTDWKVVSHTLYIKPVTSQNQKSMNAFSTYPCVIVDPEV